MTGNLDLGTNNLVVDQDKGIVNSGAWTRVTTPSGYISFGPANTTWAHIYTDRPNFYFNKDLYVNSQRVFHTGYHPNADKWTTARTLTLAGDVTGSVSWDGSDNASIAATVSSNSIDADHLNVTGNGTASQFLRSDADGSFTWATPTDTNTTYSVGDGGLTQKNFTTTLKDKLDGIATGANNYSFPYTISIGDSNSTVVRRDGNGYIFGDFYNGVGTFSTTGNTSGMGRFTGTNGTDTYGRSYTAAAARTLLNVENGATADQTAAEIMTKVKTVDGSGSGLDADLLDGVQGSSYYRTSNPSGYTTYTANQAVNTTSNPTFNDIYVADQIIHSGDTDTYTQFHAADQWRVVTGGVERFEVNNSTVTSLEPIYAPSFHGNGSALTGIATGSSISGVLLSGYYDPAGGTDIGPYIDNIGDLNTWMMVGVSQTAYTLVQPADQGGNVTRYKYRKKYRSFS